MAIANVICKGVGFDPGSTKFIPTHGFDSAAVLAETAGPDAAWVLSRRPASWLPRERAAVFTLTGRPAVWQLGDREEGK